MDRVRAGAFLDQLKASYQGAMLTMMVDLGRRLGLFEALARGGAATSHELAARTGLDERNVREWIGSVAVGGIVEWDGETGRATLPPEHAMWLTGASVTNIAPMSSLLTGLAPRLDDVESAFRSGTGVAYANYRPHFTCAMDMLGRAKYDAMLVSTYLSLDAGLAERLRSGVDVIDVGCGTGHCLNLMAAAFPASRFTGVDFSPDAVEHGREESRAMGLSNASFEVVDLSQRDALPAGAHDVVFAFDAIHDQNDPSGVLARIRSTLRTGGIFAMFDIKASSSLSDNLGDPMNVILYGTSVMHCMQVSLAGGGPGLGTVWGTQLATKMLNDAGFPDVTIHDLPADPTNCLYACPV
jgi:SAM-dependent methyltransferase